MLTKRVLIGANMGLGTIQQAIGVCIAILLRLFCECMPRQVHTDEWP